MNGLLQGYLAALVATMVWAGNFIAARALAWSIPPCQFNFWRWLIAFLAILPFALPHLKEELPVIKAHLRYLSIMAFLGVTLMNAFIYKAGQTAESLNMALLMLNTPIVILVLARIYYGERISPLRLFGMSLATCGIFVLLCRGELRRLLDLDINSGDLWTLGCMTCFALYSLLMRQRSHAISAAGFNFTVFGLGLLFALPMTLFELFLNPLPEWNWPVVTGILYSGLGCSALAFWLWTIGIDRIGPVRAAIIYYSLPLFAALMAWIVLDETVNAAQLIGGALILSGILISTLSRNNAR